MMKKLELIAAKEKPAEEKLLSQSVGYTLIPPPKSGMKPVDEKALGRLLRLVAEGEQKQAEKMIKKDKNLLLYAGTVTDLSGREFKKITAFQYALWAMDWHMWKMIQKYLPLETQARQFAALESQGTEHDKHFSLQPLIGALQMYVNNVQKIWKYDQRAENHWCNVVGGEQKHLPASIINEYCRKDRSFNPCPNFIERKLPRTRFCELWDGSKSVQEDWFTSKYSGGSLGDTFAFYRGWRKCPGAAKRGRGRGRWNAAITDLEALQSLSKARTRQWKSLELQLKLSPPKADRKEIVHRQSSNVEISSSELKKSIMLPTVPITPISQNRYGWIPKNKPVNESAGTIVAARK
jgi:hypothetical protein